MTIKLYKTVLLLCTITAIAFFFSSCAEKDDILLEEPEEKTVQAIIEEPLPSEPSWADGIVTITTGRYQTKDGLVQAIQQKKYFRVLRDARLGIHRMDVPMSKRKKTVDITVVTLEEAGFSGEWVTLEEILVRFRQLGYRPLTIEEALELRLQFEDQPDMSNTDMTETERKWGNIWTLLSKQDALSLCTDRHGEITGNEALLFLYRASAWDGFNEGFGINKQRQGIFDPHTQNKWIKRLGTTTPYGASFACAIIN